MKRVLFPALMLSMAIGIQAGTSPITTGYYHVQNASTKRYVYVRDDYGAVNEAATTADYDAIWLLSGEERPHYDPSGIIYIDVIEGNKCNMKAQGTSVYDLLSIYPDIVPSPVENGIYKIGGSAKGITKYLSDGESNLDEEMSFLRDAGGTSAKDRQRWMFHPVANIPFGIKPTVTTADGRKFASFFADFPITAKSAGVKIYAITRTANGYAAYTQVNGTVAAGTPVIIECPTSAPESNLITIGGSGSTPAQNALVGVYFQNTYAKGPHWDVVNNDPSTMRVLGKTASGEIGFVTSSAKYIDPNTGYLRVQPGTPSEVRIVTEQEFDISGIDEIIGDSDTDSTPVYYDLNGRRVDTPSTHGIYIRLTGSKAEKIVR